ncbi:MAG: hypothetical protein Q4C06_01915 [Bacillota bacterium]|nr:hypothetical protein [Bacillota bacterium]
MIDQMEAVGNGEKKVFSVCPAMELLLHGAMLPVYQICGGCHEKLSFDIGIKQVSSSFILAKRKYRGGLFGYLACVFPAIRSIAAAEDAALFEVKKIKGTIFRFQIFDMGILHDFAPELFFITVYAGGRGFLNKGNWFRWKMKYTIKRQMKNPLYLSDRRDFSVISIKEAKSLADE